MLLPWFLIVLGTFFLLENLGLLPPLDWSIIWPLLLILAGFYLLRKKCGSNCCSWKWEKKDNEKK